MPSVESFADARPSRLWRQGNENRSGAEPFGRDAKALIGLAIDGVTTLAGMQADEHLTKS